MTRTPYPGGSYVDALPSGDFAILFPGSHVQTHAGRIALPGDDWPIYHRITNRGGFKFAGKAQHSFRTLEFANWQWAEHPDACGVSPVIYDQAGNLVISNCGPVGSQGFRYVDEGGTIWTGDQTYGPLFGLTEYSYYRNLFIGQGHDGGGVKVFNRDDQSLRILDTGACTFVRVNGDGDRVAISYVKVGEGAVIVQATLAELKALPVESAPPSQPPAQPPPVPQPQPQPEPPAVDYLSIITTTRAKYGTPLGADHWKFLVEVAQKTGTQLFKKDGGAHVLIPALNVNVSADIIGRGSLGDHWADILGDSEGEARPAFSIGDGPAGGEYVDVSRVALPGAPAPPPAPKTLEERVAALEARVHALDGK